MPRVVCRLQNASTLISGVAFERRGEDGAMVSEEVIEAVAEVFLRIPGYEPLAEAEAPRAEAKPAEDKPEPKRARNRAATKHED